MRNGTAAAIRGVIKETDIPIGARILSAVDCLDALASDRPYRAALPLDEAMDMVRRQSGKSYDPAIVAILEQKYLELDRLARGTVADTPLPFQHCRARFSVRRYRQSRLPLARPNRKPSPMRYSRTDCFRQTGDSVVTGPGSRPGTIHAPG